MIWHKTKTNQLYSFYNFCSSLFFSFCLSVLLSLSLSLSLYIYIYIYILIYMSVYLYIYIYIYTWSKVELATVVKGDLKGPFSIATTPRCKGGRYSFPGLFHFTLDLYLIMLSVKQGSIEYHFLSLWYDATRDWTQVSRAIGEHSNHHANVLNFS